MMKRSLCILFGGASSEHAVSLRSAASVISHLNTEKYDLSTVGITRDGHWMRFYGDAAQIEDGSWETDARNAACVISPDASHHGLLYADGRVERIDVVFPVMHGETCEDGVMQGLLKLSGIPFVGCGVAASANTMDKAITKVFAERAGVRQAKAIVCRSSEFGEADVAGAVAALGLPIFVKPARTGSSVGVSKVKTAETLVEAVKFAGKYDGKVILEECIVGQEIECAVFGDAYGEVLTSVVGEVAAADEFYSYEAKYDDIGSELFIPARISEETVLKVRENAEKVYRALECFGLSRVDFFYTTDGEVVFNEINSLPGFTSISMYPQLFEASGLPYAELIDRLVELAFTR